MEERSVTRIPLNESDCGGEGDATAALVASVAPGVVAAPAVEVVVPAPGELPAAWSRRTSSNEEEPSRLAAPLRPGNDEYCVCISDVYICMSGADGVSVVMDKVSISEGIRYLFSFAWRRGSGEMRSDCG